jgi:hypothetical protein
VVICWDKFSVPYNIVCTFSALAYGRYSLTGASFGMIARTDLYIVCAVDAIFVLCFSLINLLCVLRYIEFTLLKLSNICNWV